jgi:hypothetical protein
MVCILESLAHCVIKGEAVTEMTEEGWGQKLLVYACAALREACQDTVRVVHRVELTTYGKQMYMRALSTLQSPSGIGEFW